MTSVARRTGDAELETLLDPSLRRHLRDTIGTEAVLAAVLRPDSQAIDVGANVGAVLEHVARLAPRGRHLAYEPIPRLARQLAARFPQVDVRQAALADENGTSGFHHVLRQEPYSGLLLRNGIPGEVGPVEKITVEVRRLDDDLPDGFRPALIKIDVEGAEVKVLRGATETLMRFHPVLIFEHDRAGVYGTGSDELWDLLHGCGYRIFNAEGAGPYDRERFHAPAHEWNYMAFPSR